MTQSDSIHTTTTASVSAEANVSREQKSQTGPEQRVKQPRRELKSERPSVAVPDSVRHSDSDTLLTELDSVPAIVIVPESKEACATSYRTDSQLGSWLLMGVLLVFCLVCIRFRSNKKYFGALLRDLTTTRERGNAFDDTVRETSFKILLNLLCAVTTGLLIYLGCSRYDASIANERFAWSSIGAGCIYALVMPQLYLICGNVFADSSKARFWVQGFISSQALLGILLLTPLLIGLFYPGATEGVVIISLILLIIIKLIFIFKGFRIFFSQISSWMLFLYYLCTLEIIPIIGMVYAAYIIYRL